MENNLPLVTEGAHPLCGYKQTEIKKVVNMFLSSAETELDPLPDDVVILKDVDEIMAIHEVIEEDESWWQSFKRFFGF